MPTSVVEVKVLKETFSTTHPGSMVSPATVSPAVTGGSIGLASGWLTTLSLEPGKHLWALTVEDGSITTLMVSPGEAWEMTSEGCLISTMVMPGEAWEMTSEGCLISTMVMPGEETSPRLELGDEELSRALIWNGAAE
jgi:hypothetical protein